MKKLYMFVFVLLIIPFAFAALDDDIVSYYTLDETSGVIVIDSVGNYNLTNNNAVVNASGKIDTSYNYNGASSYLSTSSQPVPIGDGAFTISGWFNTTSTNPQSVWSINDNSGTEMLYLGLNYAGPDNHVFRIRDENSGGTLYFVNWSATYTNTGWHHFATVVDADTLYVFIDGVSIGNATKGDAQVWNYNNFYIGGRKYASTNDQFFSGTIDEVGIWTRAFSVDDVQEIYTLQDENNAECAQYPRFDCVDNLTITAIDTTTSSAINIFNVTINSVVFSTTNGTILTPYNKSEPFLANIIFNANGYFERTYSSYTTDTNLQAELTPIGLLNLQIKNQATNVLITDLINITLQSTTEEFNLQTSNGTYFLTDLELNEPYNIFLMSDSYNNNQYTFTYTQSTSDPYVMYMSVNTTIGEEITFNVLNTQNTPINDVTVAVQKFVNGTYQTISQKTTDLSGDVIFVLEQGVTHRITFTKDGFTTQEFVSQLPLTSYSIILESASDYDFVGVAGGVSYFYTPSSLFLTPSATQPFNFTVSSSSADIFNYAVSIYNGTTLLTQASGNTPTGGTASLTFDTTPYNNSQLRAVYSFTKANYTQYQITVYYTIQDQASQSVFSMRDFAINNISLRDRIIIWSVIMLALILIFALLGNPLAVLFIVAALAPLVAWIIGLSSIIIGFMSALLIIGILANRGSLT